MLAITPGQIISLEELVCIFDSHVQNEKMYPMNPRRIYSLLVLAIFCLLAANSTFAQKKTSAKQPAAVPLEKAKLVGDEKITTPYGVMELQHNYLTDESSQKLFDAMDLQRASQAYMWSTPLVSFVTWREEQNKHYGPNARGTFAVYVSFREKQGIVTGNLTTPYLSLSTICPTGHSILNTRPERPREPHLISGSDLCATWASRGRIRARVERSSSLALKTTPKSMRRGAFMFISRPRTISCGDSGYWIPTLPLKAISYPR
jgi:hypothetical protein